MKRKRTRRSYLYSSKTCFPTSTILKNVLFSIPFVVFITFYASHNPLHHVIYESPLLMTSRHPRQLQLRLVVLVHFLLESVVLL